VRRKRASDSEYAGKYGASRKVMKTLAKGARGIRMYIAAGVAKYLCLEADEKGGFVWREYVKRGQLREFLGARYETMNYPVLFDGIIFLVFGSTVDNPTMVSSMTPPPPQHTPPTLATLSTTSYNPTYTHDTHSIACTNTRTRTSTQSFTNKHTIFHTHRATSTHTHTHTHTHIHRYKHRHKHKHTHTHTRTPEFTP
jgi:hypothetical protein